MLIEPHIAGLAAQRATPQDIMNLELLVKAMAEFKVNSSAVAELDVRFHTAVAECTHNEVLIRIIPIINESIRRSHVETHDDTESFKRAKCSHMGIYKAIAGGDFMAARFFAERHVWETFADMRKDNENKETIYYTGDGGCGSHVYGRYPGSLFFGQFTDRWRCSGGGHRSAG